jgi:serine/threonine protein kinase
MTAEPIRGLQQLGRYELMRRLAVGGMAEVFLARTRGIDDFGKVVVVKRLLPHMAREPELVRRFMDEARLGATLVHPNIAQVFDVGREGEDHFIALEYVPGRDLHHVMQQSAERRVPIPIEAALAIGIGVCAGLHHAHERRDETGRPLGIVHRDVSPSNVLVGFEGAVKVVDFGIARAASHRQVTRDGMVKGKVGYMSPEQATGEALDRRSDLFAIGVLLWELTTGARLHDDGANEAVLFQRIIQVDAPKPSSRVAGYPPALEAIVMRALSRDRAVRHATAQELQIDLENFAREHKLSASAIEVARLMDDLFAGEREAERRERETLSRPARRVRRPWLGLAGAAALVLAGAAAFGADRAGRARAEASDYQSFDDLLAAGRTRGRLAGGAAIAGAALLAAQAVQRRRRVSGTR